MRKLLTNGLVSYFFLSMTGCGGPGGLAAFFSAGQHPQPPGNPADGGRFTVCSELNFSSVQWPIQLQPKDQIPLEIALNISGSFEGSKGWSNITGDFDGTGLSLGLLNQTLGTGSLQPLLIKMRDRHLDVMEGVMNPDKLSSLLDMLHGWETSPASVNEEEPTSIFDDPGEFSMSASGRNSASVQWAIDHLYKGNSFVSGWDLELGRLANTPEYVAIQIEAALGLHQLARNYVNTVGVFELRSYLMMFDVAVQNGHIYDVDFQDYSNFLLQHPSSSPTQKLEEMLALRLRHVKAQWVNDVLSRKQTIIDGRGVVHGDNLNLEKKYCFDRLTPFN